jgi:hypothetical protein|uniref:Uncharacterized protein n=1 Tax=Populus trichocarpa TaxID=3694 RepID=A0A3N7G0I5_POPTR
MKKDSLTTKHVQKGFCLKQFTNPITIHSQNGWKRKDGFAPSSINCRCTGQQYGHQFRMSGQQSQNARFPLVKISTKRKVNCSHPVQIQGNNSSTTPDRFLVRRNG